MSEELKPCPFCGGEAKIKAVNQKSYGLTIWCQCKKCGVKTEEYCPITNNEDTTLDSIEKCKNTVLEQWNRRVNDENTDRYSKGI